MKSRTGTKISLFCFLFVGLCLLINSSVLQAARVTGENGITPVAPETQKKARIPAEVKTSAKGPAQDKPARTARDKIRKNGASGNRQVSGEGEDRYVTIDFDNVDLKIFIKFISELTGRNFVYDKAVNGKITIISPTKISVKEAYRVFESVLEVHGYAAVPAGNITKIIPAIQARTKDIETRLREEAGDSSDKVVTQLIPLTYADPENLKKLFAPLISKSSVIVSYPPTGMLIVTDVLSNINRLIRIINAIDVEGIGERLSVVSIEHATASVLAKSLNAIFQRTGGKVKKGLAGFSDIRIVPDERTNVLIVLASEDDSMKIKQLIALLDTETPRGEGDIHVYYLQNANAEDMTQVLTAIPSGQAGKAGKGKAPVVSKEVQIVADKATNSLVITANKDDYLVLEDVIKKLDIPRRMVYIEALIMEVDVGRDFDLGVEWSFSDKLGHYGGDDRAIGAFGGSTQGSTSSNLPTVDATSGVVRLPTGFSLGVLGEGITIGDVYFPSVAAVIRAYQDDSDVHILSTPQIMTTDNEEAEIYVGENRPFLTSQERSAGDLDYSNYEFKDVGVKLNITPQINQERFVRLEISQEVSQVISETTEGLPTTLKRTAKTTVIVKDTNTLVIGGLIEKTASSSTYKVPILGDIPVLGWLFKSKSSVEDSKNLFIFLTPYIIENSVEAARVYEKKKKKIDRIIEGDIKMYEKPKAEGKRTED